MHESNGEETHLHHVRIGAPLLDRLKRGRSRLRQGALTPYQAPAFHMWKTLGSEYLISV
jgi:hypothetical protein